MIPVSEPILGSGEWQNVKDCIENGLIANGSYIDEFERRWANYCGKQYGVAVSSGTTALQLAIEALALPAGSEVIIPSFTIISCALAVIRNNCTPVLVDVDPDTWCLDPWQIKDVITSRTRAVMPVHMYGHPVDMENLLQFAQSENLFVVEDAAQAHGAEYQRWDNMAKAGSGGHLSCFSFYANKIITTGEGGMVLTDDQNWANRVRSLRNLCFGAGEDRFDHVGLGYNFRMTNLQAAIGVSQIERLDLVVRRKRDLADYYRQLLNHPAIQHPAEKEWAKNVYWMYGIVLDRPAKPIMAKLRERGIETRPFFRGLHQQSCLRLPGSFPVTEKLAECGLYLPSGVTLQIDQIEEIANAVLESL